MNDYLNSRKGQVYDCSQKATFGYDLATTPVTSRFGYYHKDVLGQWYVAPATGSVDTIYFYTNGTIGAVDSSFLVRIYKSNITPWAGPGAHEAPPPGDSIRWYPAGCRSWGYWVNTQDADQGVAAFADEATDPTWHSTIETQGVPKATFPPFSTNLWGGAGVPIKIKYYTTNKFALDILPGGLHVNAGDVFFISMKVKSNNPHVAVDVRTEIAAGEENAPWPGRMWKFYEHDSGPSNCSGTDPNIIKRGWVYRAGFDPVDTLSTGAYNVWYAMTPESNIPPVIDDFDRIPNTLSTGPQVLSATIIDCDVEHASRAGVQDAYIKYHLGSNEATEYTVPLLNTFGDQWEATIPGYPKGDTVYYKVFATDSFGLETTTGSLSYKIIDLNSSYYKCDTSVAWVSNSIHGATKIDTSEIFLPPTAFSGTSVPHKGDDGTAGPYAIGNGGFVFYGDTMHYAWVGVNGAIALSKTATDTIDVNSNGFATTGWDFPYRQHAGRFDTSNSQLMPSAFIAPFWADWIVKQDSPIAAFGAIRYEDTPTKFTVEWDSIGTFFDVGAQPDVAVFRVILNKTTGIIDFQYDEVGIGGNDTLDLVGIQQDSSATSGPIPAYNYFNRNRYPLETKPRSAWAIRYLPAITRLSISGGWNLLSVGMIPMPENYAKTNLYPTATSPAFKYVGSYQQEPTLTTGPGYWLKFAGAQTVSGYGGVHLSDTIPVSAGWNMIGSLSVPVPIGTITCDPPGLVTPSTVYYKYSGSYQSTTNLLSGQGHWVKVATAGNLFVNAGGPAVSPEKNDVADELGTLRSLSFTDRLGQSGSLYLGTEGQVREVARFELPPTPPEGAFDVRFAGSNGIVGLYPSIREQSKHYEYPISLQGSYPVTVRWTGAVNGDGAAFAIVNGKGDILATLGGNESGKYTINEQIEGLRLRVIEASDLYPTSFALSQNYPNPFNPVTRLVVSIAQMTDVDVSVYDILGRKVRVLLSGEQQAGYKQIEWDSKDNSGMQVPTGLYFIRMSVPETGFQAVQKALLVK